MLAYCLRLGGRKIKKTQVRVMLKNPFWDPRIWKAQEYSESEEDMGKQ